LADVFGFLGLRAFEQLVRQQTSIVGIVCGHIHCVRGARIGNAPVVSAVSTALQLVPEVFERRPLWLRPERGGVMLHEWDPVRGLSSHTYRNFGSERFLLE
jgi:hypothetical protein